MLLQDLSAAEVRDTVHHFVKDIPEVIVRKGLFIVQSAQGFKHIQPDGMFLLAMSKNRAYAKNRLAHQAGKLLFGEWQTSDILVTDFEDPQKSIHVSVAPDDKVMVSAGDFGAKDFEVRSVIPADIDRVNTAILSTGLRLIGRDET